MLVLQCRTEIARPKPPEVAMTAPPRSSRLQGAFMFMPKKGPADNMRSAALALLVLAAPLAAATSLHAQGPDGEDMRYSFHRVEDGFLRLDMRNGQVSLCSRRAVGWTCQVVPDDRLALESEIARLQTNNAALKKELLDRGLALPGAVRDEPKPAPPAAKGPAQPSAPSQADIDKVRKFIGQAWQRLVDMINSLQREFLQKT
jgi:hypothetical protein